MGGAESAANEAIERGGNKWWPTDYGGGRRYSGGMIQPERKKNEREKGDGRW